MNRRMRDNGEPLTDYPETLSPEENSRLFENIMTNLDFDPDEKPGFLRRKTYWSFVFHNYILKNGLSIAAVFLFLFLLLPGTLIPAPISDVSAASPENERSARVEFKIDSLLPVQKVSARLNNRELELTKNRYQSYSVDVEENGYLLLEVLSISGMRSSHKIKIDSIDEEPPHIASHHRDGDKIFIYLSDEGGSGVDYEAIRAYDPDTHTNIFPIDYDEAKECVVFVLPKNVTYITIPDNSDNKLTAILTPPDSIS